MSFDFGELTRMISGDDFEETPVDIEEFVTGPDYLNMAETPLSEYQYQIIKASTQIYRKETLIDLYGEEEGLRRYREYTKSEVICQLGKGSLTGDAEVYDPRDGRWRRMDALLKTVDNRSAGVPHGTTTLSSEFATEAFSEGFDRVYTVETERGYRVKANANHKFLTRDGLKPLKDIKVGERIGTAINLPLENEVPLPENEVRLMGYIMNSSALDESADTLCLSFRPESTNTINDFVDVIKTYGETPLVIRRKLETLIAVDVTPGSEMEAVMSRMGIAGTHPVDRHVPDSAWALPKEQLRIMLSRAFADCELSDEPNIKMKLQSKELALGITRLCARLGISAAYTEMYMARSNIYKITFRDAETVHRFLSQIPLLDRAETIEAALAVADFKRGRPARGGKNNYAYYADDIFWTRVSRIAREREEQEIYTITASETANYVSNLMVHGNSGKDFTATIACAYVVYLLLCLKEPAKYYHKPKDDTIDIINVAVNAAQANNVFFKNFVKRIKNAPWFEGKYVPKAGQIEFDKYVTVYSGHSERESFEGYNTFFVILDEISAFAMDNNSGGEMANTAQAVYDTYKASITSRFAEGKLVLLSFPRYKTDFISTRYNEVIVTKEIVSRSETVKLDPDLPDKVEGNEFDISWDEDHITQYNVPGIFALRRPSWEVNPTKTIQNYVMDFYQNPSVAGGKFACMPPDAEDAFFKDKSKIETAFALPNGVDNGTGAFTDHLQPNAEKSYYIHVDLAQKHDRCVVSMAHVESWKSRELSGIISKTVSPVVHLDAVRYWTPTDDKSVDFAEVRDYIVALRAKGFNIKLVTFDRWNSNDMINYLRGIGMRSEILSVAIKHYTDLAMMVHEERVFGPDIKLLRDELLRLKIMNNGKIDHPRSGSKDISDSVCGAVFNAITYTRRTDGDEVEIVTYQDLVQGKDEPINRLDPNSGAIKAPPGTQIPVELADFMFNLKVIGD